MLRAPAMHRSMHAASIAGSTPPVLEQSHGTRSLLAWCSNSCCRCLLFCTGPVVSQNPLDALTNAVQNAASTLAGVVNSTVSAVENAGANVGGAFNRTRDAAGGITSSVGNAFEGATNASSNGVGGLIATVTNITSGAINATRAAAANASTAVASFVNRTMDSTNLLPATGGAGAGANGGQQPEPIQPPWASSAKAVRGARHAAVGLAGVAVALVFNLI